MIMQLVISSEGLTYKSVGHSKRQGVSKQVRDRSIVASHQVGVILFPNAMTYSNPKSRFHQRFVVVVVVRQGHQ